MMSCLIFKSLSHSEFIFLPGVRVCSSLTDLDATLQLSQHPSLHRDSRSLPGCPAGSGLATSSGDTWTLPILQLLLRLRGGPAGCGSSGSSQAA